MKNKKTIQGPITRFIGGFLDSIYKGTEKRFMNRASKRLQNPEVSNRMTQLDKEIKDLEDFIKNLIKRIKSYFEFCH